MTRRAPLRLVRRPKCWCCGEPATQRMRRANGKEVAACSKRKCIDFVPCSQVDGLHPDWRYIPGPQFFQHRKTGEVRAHGSCIGWYEQFPDDYPPFSLGPDKPPPAVKLLRPAPDALTFFAKEPR